MTPHATYRPELADAEIVAKRPFTLVYHIRPKARWSDGVPVSAQDFVFTQQALRKHPLTDPCGNGNVRSVRRVDPKTVRVVLREPFADWRDLFCIVLPQHVLAGQKLAAVWQDSIDDPRTGGPIGDGPFLVGTWERGKQLTLVRNPRYWGSHVAYLDRLVYRFLPIENLSAALRRGEIDMIDPAPFQLQAAALEFRRKPEPGIRVLMSASSSYEQISIRIGGTGNPALEKPLVRQALAYGIDRVEIARSLGKLSLDDAAALEPQDNVFFLANGPYYRPNWKGYRYRPARARQLLEQAGCRRGPDGIFVCGGHRLSLGIGAVAGVERRARTVELVQAQLRRIGVEARPRFSPVGVWINQILPNGDFDLALFTWGSGASSTAGWEDVLGCRGDQNLTGYCNRLVTRDLVRATRTIDDRRRARLLNRIDVRLAKAVPLIPLFQNKGLFALKASVRGVVPNGVGSWTWNAEDWWLDR